MNSSPERNNNWERQPDLVFEDEWLNPYTLREEN